MPVLAMAGLLPAMVQAAPIDVLFVGNSYSFGHHDPVMSYNAGNITDLTSPDRGGTFTNTGGSNPYQPHPWGGVAGIFKQLPDQSGLAYNVYLSARSAASLRGHFLNTNPAGWDLRGNIGLQSWDKVVLQEQSSEPLANRENASGNELGSTPEYFYQFSNIIENYIRSDDPIGPIRYRDGFPGETTAERQAACVAAGIAAGTCSNDRGTFDNPNANPDAEVYLYQTWARPNLVDGAYATVRDDSDGSITRTDQLSEETHYSSLQEMADELRASFLFAYDNSALDGSGGLDGIAPVGDAFMRAIEMGVATGDFWATEPDDGLLNLWFDDGTHASTYGSYLSALVLFGTMTGLDPAMFGAGEIAAFDLGIDSRSALLLQRVASDQLGFSVAPPPAVIPLPASAPLILGGLGMLVLLRRRARRA